MVKNISLGIIVLTLIVGGIVIFYKSTVPEESPVLGLETQVKQLEEDTTKPDTSFQEQENPAVSPTPANTIIPTEGKKGPYSMEIDTKKQYEAVLKTTVGDITIALTAGATPVTVNNFVALARKNFYSNTIFHRIIKGFMIQGGDPNGNGTGGPGYSFADEKFEGDYKRGVVAMANAGPNTNGSQFFIMHADYPLPKNYVIFGSVTDGIDVVDKIAESPVKSGGEGSTPVNPTIITSVQIIEK